MGYILECIKWRRIDCSFIQTRIFLSILVHCFVVETYLTLQFEIRILLKKPFLILEGFTWIFWLQNLNKNKGTRRSWFSFVHSSFLNFVFSRSLICLYVEKVVDLCSARRRWSFTFCDTCNNVYSMVCSCHVYAQHTSCKNILQNPHPVGRNRILVSYTM